VFKAQIVAIGPPIIIPKTIAIINKYFIINPIMF
jgi:hypothetical protein